MNLNEVFHKKYTENGDVAFDAVSAEDNLLNILFMSEYYQKHLNEVHIGKTERDRLFARFVRDPRFGLGRRDLGRVLMHDSGCSIDEIVKSGRVDDLFIYNIKESDYYMSKDVLDYLYKEILNGNELVKKWMPRYRSKNLVLARAIAKEWGMNKQQYGHFIKCDTTENKLSRKNTDDIIFEHVPSLAMIKYYQRFISKEDTKERFQKYLDDVKSGKKEIKVSTTTVYDIYKNRDNIDPDLFFDKIEKISINCLPIVDTSGSMCDSNDSIGKALAIGHYLSKCSTYAKDKVVSFSSKPQLLTLGKANVIHNYYGGTSIQNLNGFKSQYMREIESMKTGDCSNTDFGAVMELFKDLTDVPEWLVVLSDMEFDLGSRQSKNELKRIWKENGYKTKIVWWNLNSRSTTAPEMDSEGNVFLSGYSPMLLKFLECGFDGKAFLNKLLNEYEKFLSES